jgi:hypothetical protein
MKKLSVLLMVLASFVSYGQEFMGINVEGNKDVAIKKFIALGFTSKDDHYLSAVLSGKVGSDNVELYIDYTPISKVVTCYVIYYEEHIRWNTLLYDYNALLSTLTLKYGKPDSKYSFFDKPYYTGDSYEMEGVVSGKCNYKSSWLYRSISIEISIEKSKKVCILYENKALRNISIKEIDDLYRMRIKKTY